jgi:hypothetical protein
MLQWKARLFALLTTLVLVAVAGGYADLFLNGIDW